MSTDERYHDNNGVGHRLDGLQDELPSLIYLGSLHVDVCKKIASLQGYTGDEYRIYVNLLVKHSRAAKNITALISLIEHGNLEVSSIRSNYAVKAVLEDFIDVADIRFSSQNLEHYAFLQGRVVYKLFVKMVLHRCYRIFFRKKSLSRSLVRSWVEITETMFGERYDESSILIYPFYLNLNRHLRYIRHCFKSYQQVSLCGLPYRISDWLKIALQPKYLDRNYVRFESRAYREHGAELIRLPGSVMYTSDEFEAGAIVMVNEFRARSGRVVNKAHGLSFGCPYVAYDEFTVYNSAQRDYYARLSPDTRFTVKPRINAGFKDNMETDVKAERVIVFIEANYQKLGMTYEARLQEKVIEVIREVAQNLDLRAVIKAHPNRGETEYAAYTRQAGITVIKHLNELGRVNPLFITIASAAYYDFRKFGPFLFVDDGYSDLRKFYGEELPVFAIKDLSKGISEFLNRGV